MEGTGHKSGLPSQAKSGVGLDLPSLYVSFTLNGSFWSRHPGTRAESGRILRMLNAKEKRSGHVIQDTPEFGPEFGTAAWPHDPSYYESYIGT